MARTPKQKELQGTRLLKEYASWVYCEGCGKTVAYLCYVTYDLFEFAYTCQCGAHGRVFIQFEHDAAGKSSQPLQVVKNRLCCPNDGKPLLTIVEKNVKDYRFRVVCNTCHTAFEGQSLRDESVSVEEC